MRTYIQVLLTPLERIYLMFMSARVDANKKARYNGQTIILENLLNDMFDAFLRNIRIINQIGTNTNIYIGNAHENQRIYVGNYIEAERVYIGNYAESNRFNYTFIVEVTDPLTPEAEIQLKAVVNYYRAAGTKPLFKYASGTIF